MARQGQLGREIIAYAFKFLLQILKENKDEYKVNVRMATYNNKKVKGPYYCSYLMMLV